ISFAKLTFNAQATRHDLRVVLFAIVIFVTTVTISSDPRRVRRILAAVTIIAVATAILALAQDVTHTRSIYWSIFLGDPAVNGPFANHSPYGQFMNQSIGFAIALVLLLITKHSSEQAISKWRFIAAPMIAVGIVLGWLTIALSLTRGGMIAGAVAGVFTILAL